MFKQHELKTTLHGCPTIIISRQCAADMWAIVQECSTSEVGWFCTVRRDGTNFILEEVCLPKQEAHAATCELTPEGQTEMAMELKAKDKAEGKPHMDETSRVRRLKCWVH